MTNSKLQIFVSFILVIISYLVIRLGEPSARQVVPCILDTLSYAPQKRQNGKNQHQNNKNYKNNFHPFFAFFIKHFAAFF